MIEFAFCASLHLVIQIGSECISTVALMLYQTLSACYKSVRSDQPSIGNLFGNVIHVAITRSWRTWESTKITIGRVRYGFPASWSSDSPDHLILSATLESFILLGKGMRGSFTRMRKFKILAYMLCELVFRFFCLRVRISSFVSSRRNVLKRWVSVYWVRSLTRISSPSPSSSEAYSPVSDAYSLASDEELDNSTAVLSLSTERAASEAGRCHSSVKVSCRLQTRDSISSPLPFGRFS